MPRIFTNCRSNTIKMCVKLTLIKFNRNRVTIAGYRVVESSQPQRNVHNIVKKAGKRIYML